ncbi:MAG: hypothetical protein AB8G14_05405 [Ilumatobacter sp.]
MADPRLAVAAIVADAQRAQVYAAEIAAFDGTDLERVIDVDRVIRLIEQVIASDWWPNVAVEVRAARVDAQSSSTRCGSDPASGSTIFLARSQATVATAAHELAHALAGVRNGHGRLYRRAFLDVVQVITNIDRVDARGMLHVAQLSDAFGAAGLTVGEREWSAPPSVGGAIAL